MRKNVYRIPQVLLHVPQGFPKDMGHSSDLDLKKNGMLRSLTNQTVENRVAELMMTNFRERHPEFGGTSASARGGLKSKGSGRTSIHDNAEPATAELSPRIIISVNQLSVCGAEADWC